MEHISLKSDIYHMDCKPTFLSIITAVSASSYAAPAYCQDHAAASTGQASSGERSEAGVDLGRESQFQEKDSLKVSFPGIQAPVPPVLKVPLSPVSVRAPSSQDQVLPAPPKFEAPRFNQPAPQSSSSAPSQVLPLPPAPKPRSEKLAVTRMNGEVHMSHQQGPKLDPARALKIFTGAGGSWCEFKMHELTGRILHNSVVSVFPDNKLIYVERGSAVIKNPGASETRLRVICGNYVCSLDGGTCLRVQKTEKIVDFQVLEGEISVYNKESGELFRSCHVQRPVH